MNNHITAEEMLSITKNGSEKTCNEIKAYTKKERMILDIMLVLTAAAEKGLYCYRFYSLPESIIHELEDLGYSIISYFGDSTFVLWDDGSSSMRDILEENKRLRTKIEYLEEDKREREYNLRCNELYRNLGGGH